MVLPGPDAAKRVAGFCRSLRNAGIPVTVGEELAASAALVALPRPTLEDVYLAFRLALVKDPDRARTFDAVFRSYWSRDPTIQAALEDDLNPSRPGMTHVPGDAELVQEGGDQDAAGTYPSDVSRAIRAVLYSRDAPARSRALRGIERARVQGMERRARHLRRRIATLPGRRYRRAPHGDVDFRRAARRSLRYAGEWFDLPLRSRGPRRTRLLILWDVSGSMEERHEDHLALVYALARVGGNSRVFTFGMELHEVTAHFRAQPYRATVGRMESRYASWGGGTRIGESLAALNARAGPWLDRHTVVVILSDGWDVGSLDLLRSEMSRLARRAGFVVWLNPYVAQEDFRPEVAGMRTALPFVDLLLSTDVLTSPAAFQRELGPSLSPLP